MTFKVLSYDEKKGSEFVVLVNNNFQTMFWGPGDITTTKYIGFSAPLRFLLISKTFERTYPLSNKLPLPVQNPKFSE